MGSWRVALVAGMAAVVAGCADGEGPDDDGLPAGPRPAVCVNEIMASNANAFVVDDRTPDWIELHNPGPDDVSLLGWWVSDDLDAPDKHVLGDLTVPAGGFLVLLADDGAAAVPESLSFRLDKQGEAAVLTDPDGRVDALVFGVQATDHSLARTPDCCPEPECLRAVYGGTPGATNDG